MEPVQYSRGTMASLPSEDDQQSACSEYTCVDEEEESYDQGCTDEFVLFGRKKERRAVDWTRFATNDLDWNKSDRVLVRERQQRWMEN